MEKEKKTDKEIQEVKTNTETASVSDKKEELEEVKTVEVSEEDDMEFIPKEFEDLQTLNVDGSVYKTRHTKTFEKRKIWQDPNPKKIFSTIPGTILEIMVRAGKKVKEGEVLVLLEAMKMQNKIIAPFDGKIKSINVREGEAVAKGALIIEFQ